MPRQYQDQPPTAFQRRPEYVRGDEWIRSFLRTAQVAHVASARDGQPFIHPTSFWFDEQGHQLAFHSNITGRLRSNLEAGPRACLEVSELGRLLPSNVALEFSLQFRSVMVFGTVHLVEDPEEARRLLYGLIGKYFPGMTPGREYRPITDKELHATSVYALQIDSWSGKENWQEAAEQSEEWEALTPPLSGGWGRVGGGGDGE